MRLFIGVDIPDCPEFERLRAQLTSEDVKLVSPELYHLNLKFLGEVPEKKLENVVSSLRAACAGVKPFDVLLEGGGQFPHHGRPRVIFVPASSEPLLGLAEKLGSLLGNKGFPLEKRAYKPHLTICRVRSGSPKPASILPVTVHINNVKIKRSLLTPSGPIYTTVSEERLNG